VAFALALASIGVDLHPRMAVGESSPAFQLEEAHLKKIFGAEYDDYAARTARFFPGP
jgi:protein-S-isoprenylcysteine O-methyltransferase Ste14